MNEETKKIIAERLAQLPSYIREPLKKIDWDQEIVTIGKKYGLHVDQMGTLQLETVMVLVGIVHPDEYYKSLKKELGLSDELTNNIVADVNKKVFKSIRQALIDFLAKEDTESEKIDDGEDDIEEEKIEINMPAQSSLPPAPKPVENVFRKTGIELSAERPPLDQPAPTIVVAPIEKKVLEHSGVVVSEDLPDFDKDLGIDRDGLLLKIENPPKGQMSQFTHVIATNLAGAVTNLPEKTKYSDKRPTIPNTVTPEAIKKPSSDPYREPIQ